MKTAVMFSNYWKIVFRNLRKYKSYTIINLVGMGIGIAAMVWGYQTYQYSMSFDNFHPNGDHLYRALTYRKGGDGVWGAFPMAGVEMAKHDLSGIGAAVRYNGRIVNVRHDSSETFSERVHFTDPSFFEVFNFPLIAGSHDLNDPNAVLVTQAVAKKYFGSQDPIGQTLTFYTGDTYAKVFTVKGVLKDIPFNSTLQFGMLTNFENMLKDDGTRIEPDDWSLFLDAAYFYIPDPANVPRLEQGLTKYLPVQNKAREDAEVSGFRLVTLRQNVLLGEAIRSNSLYRPPTDSATYGPFVLAFLIFLSACLNFSNTTVAHAGTRLKEIGMRKVMGSTYRQLMAQLLAECGVIVAAAILLSAVLNSWWLPYFNTMFNNVAVRADYLHDTHLQVFILCMLVGATLLAGTYSAFYISRFSPTAIFRGTVRFSGSNLFSRLMLGLQLSIAIITVVAAIGFMRNAAFQRDYDYGYNIESSMGVRLGDSTAYAPLRNELASMPEITALAGTRNHFSYNYRNAVAEFGGIRKEIDYLEVGRDYPAALGLKMAAGRSFNPSLDADYNDAVLITEKMAAMYGWNAREALSKRLYIDSTYFSVVGVLKDIQSESLFEPSMPVVLRLAKENQFRILIIEARPRDLAEVNEKVRAVWKRLFPLRPFDGFYQSQLKADAYKVNDSVAQIFLWFGVISILLTATGLFALVSLTTLKKMKEIALRKVVGAAPRHIVVLINKGYFWIFIVASFVGCCAGLALTRLLMDMIFKINVGVGMGPLIWAVVVLFVIAAVTSGIKVWQAVRSNPVKMLRSE
jgi:putative ABC transport system permease protein